MNTIHKYKLELASDQVVMMPAGAKILLVAEQDDTICLWAIVNTEHRMIGRSIIICGTGQQAYFDKKYIGTVLMFDDFVWHVFEE